MRAPLARPLFRRFGQIVFQPVDVVVAIGDVGVADQVAEQRQRRLDAVDHELVERAAQPHHAFDAVAAMHDQLADQAVVIGRDAVAGIDAGIDADAEAARRVEMRDRAGRGHEGARVLGIDAALDGVALEA